MKFELGDIVTMECGACCSHNKWVLYRIRYNVEYSNGKFKTYDFIGIEEGCSCLHKGCRFSIKNIPEQFKWLNVKKI